MSSGIIEVILYHLDCKQVANKCILQQLYSYTCLLLLLECHPIRCSPFAVIALSLSVFNKWLCFGISFFRLVNRAYIRFEYSLLFNPPASVRILQIFALCLLSNWVALISALISLRILTHNLSLMFAPQNFPTSIFRRPCLIASYTLHHAEVACVWWISWKSHWIWYHLQFLPLCPCTVWSWVSWESTWLLLCCSAHCNHCTKYVSILSFVLLSYFFDCGSCIRSLLQYAMVSSPCFWMCFSNILQKNFVVSLVFNLLVCLIIATPALELFEQIWVAIGILDAARDQVWSNLSLFFLQYTLPFCLVYQLVLQFLRVLWRYSVWRWSLFGGLTISILLSLFQNFSLQSSQSFSSSCCFSSDRVVLSIFCMISIFLSCNSTLSTI